MRRSLAATIEFTGPDATGAWPAVLAVADTPFRPRGSEADETIPASVLRDCATSTGHRLRDAVLLGHPAKWATSYETAFGDVENLQVEENKLTASIRLSEARTPPEVARALVAGRPVEVSIGASIGGVEDGCWTGPIRLDHVAVLSSGGAAFNLATGAGLARAAEEGESMTLDEVAEALRGLSDDERTEVLAEYQPPAPAAMSDEDRQELHALRADLAQRQAAERKTLAKAILDAKAAEEAELNEMPLETLRVLAGAVNKLTAEKTARFNAGPPKDETRYASLSSTDWRDA